MESGDGLQKRQVRTLPSQKVCAVYAVCADNHENLPNDLRLENNFSCWIPEDLLCQIEHFLEEKPWFQHDTCGQSVVRSDPRQGEGADDPGGIEGGHAP